MPSTNPSRMTRATKRLIASLKECVSMLESAYEGEERAAKDYGVTAAIKRARKAIAAAETRRSDSNASRKG